MLGRSHTLAGASASVALAIWLERRLHFESEMVRILFQGSPVAALSAGGWLSMHAARATVAMLGSFGALLPDLDISNSTASNLVRRAAPIVCIACAVIGYLEEQSSAIIVAMSAAGLFATLLLPMMIASPPVAQITGGHRGATHSVLVWVWLAAIFCLLARRSDAEMLRMIWIGLFFIATGAGIGGAMADMVTHGGVSALWPLTGEKYHLLPAPLRFSTGGLFERIVVVPVLLLVTGFLLIE